MALAQKGIDIRQTGTHLAFRSLLQDSTGAILATGTTSLYLYELQSDGTLKSYDWNDNTFKATALTTETASMTHRTGNNGGTNTGIWTYVLATLSGFTAGGVYFARVRNTGASPTDQVREFQYGGAEGDLLTTAGSTGQATLQADLRALIGTLLTESATGRLKAALTTFLDVASPVFTAASVNQTGDNYARIGAAGAGLTALGDARLANLDAAVSSRSTYAGGDTAGTTTLLARLTATRAGLLDQLALVDAAISSRLASASYTAPPSAAANAAAVLTTAMTESYAADGVAPTLAQAVFAALQRLTEFAISGSTIVVYKLDGTTEAFRLSLNSATAPTSSARTA